MFQKTEALRGGAIYLKIPLYRTAALMNIRNNTNKRFQCSKLANNYPIEKNAVIFTKNVPQLNDFDKKMKKCSILAQLLNAAK